jgi:peptidoglycan lytic transglycosylase G
VRAIAPRRVMPRVLSHVLPAAVLLAIVAIGGALTARHLFTMPGPLPTARDVVVPHGGAMRIAQTLQEANVIASPLAFRLAMLATAGEGPLHAAELAFPAHAPLREVLTTLRTAHPVEHRLTIPEGLTARQITALLDHADALTGAVALPDEGAVLPDTYSYEYGTTRAALLARAQVVAGKALAAAWADRDPGVPLASPRDALILASIVERETAKPDERAHIAAVFLNRLRRGMRLQADSTVVYAASGGLGMLNHPLTRGELEQDSPYNTYRSHDLPPEPICAPGMASLRAVLHPAPSDDLYFVADGAGGHVFAATLAQHEANVKRWRSLEVR